MKPTLQKNLRCLLLPLARARGVPLRGFPAQSGFTLIESIVVIVLIGIVGGMVSVFMKAPIDAYVDTARRGELTAIADSASRFMAREIHAAVPNSMRVTTSGGQSFLEFVPIVPVTASGIGGAGRYQAEAYPIVNKGLPLDFTYPPNSGYLAEIISPAGYQNTDRYHVVIGNLGIVGVSDVYADPQTDSSSTRRRLQNAGYAGASNALLIDETITYPLPTPSPGSRFQIAGDPITYVCTPSAGSAGTLMRYSGYGFNPKQPTSFTVTPNRVADKVSGCRFSYSAAQQGRGFVTIWLEISESDETVRLQTQVNVDNAI